MGIKKTFILFCGVSWCGTTSLYYTLTDKIKYVHGGWTKESKILSKIFFSSVDAFNANHIEKNIQKVLYLSLRNFETKKINDDVLLKFTKDEIYDYFNASTLDQYVDYYIKLAEYCGEDYQAVGDFSNTNILLEEFMVYEIYSKLNQYFDVKVLMILRDPIRKNWSKTCAHTNGISHFPIYSSSSKVTDNFKNTPCINYAEKIKELYKIFGKDNVHYIIMEDFFNGDKNHEVIKLEKFLNTEINTINPCVFVPDKGINPPKINGLKDQWASDHEILTPEFYNHIRSKIDYVNCYEDFKELHGYLPADWGRPIDYGY